VCCFDFQNSINKYILKACIAFDLRNSIHVSGLKTKIRGKKHFSSLNDCKGFFQNLNEAGFSSTTWPLGGIKCATFVVRIVWLLKKWHLNVGQASNGS
jgi:hypothetical protein